MQLCRTWEGEGRLAVDLTGAISPVEGHDNISFHVEEGPIPIQPKGSNVLLSVHGFHDCLESRVYVENLVATIVGAAKSMRCEKILVNCNRGQNRAPLIACRILAVLRGCENKPSQDVYDIFSDFCKRYYDKYEETRCTAWSDNLPTKWPRFCYAPWCQLEIADFSRRAGKKFPLVTQGIHIEIGYSITLFP